MKRGAVDEAPSGRDDRRRVAKSELVLRGGKAVLASGVADLDIGISGGRISAIAERGALASDEAVDVEGKVLLPGAIDLHVHCREPGLTHKEDFAHATAAAACGGVTFICDMPNTNPPPVTEALLQEKIELVEDTAHVDWALWAGGTNVDEYRGMAERGAIGLKVYMIEPRSKLDAYSTEIAYGNDETLLEALRASAEIGWPVSVHVENETLARAERKRLEDAGRRDPRAVYESFRGISSVEAMQRVLLFGAHTNVRLHVAHISLGSIAGLRLFRRSRAEGKKFTTEIPPPLLDLADLERLGAYAFPFILSDEEMREYWDALRDGTIDAIATDHAPHTREEKEIDDVWRAPTGYPGVETSLPLMFDAVLRGELGLRRLVDLMARRPSEILQVEAKGDIAVGKDADIVVIDPEAEWTIDETRLHSKAGWSPYHGRRLRGRIVQTLLRGRLVASDGELVDPDTPWGKGIRERTTAPVSTPALS